MGIIAPFSVFSALGKQTDAPVAETVIEEQTTIETVKMEIPVLFANGNVERLDLDEYLTGVLLAEMPASFEMEALKAQAVVARTYTLKRVEAGNKHTGGAICTKPACCQAYCSPSEYMEKGNSQESLDRVKRAVMHTSGKVLLYQGEYIEATYFSCSGGRTEDALAVWGSDIPYLQAVESPGEESAEHYTDEVSFTVDEFKDKLGIPRTEMLKIGSITYTDGSGVDKIIIANRTFSGTEMRQKLGLRSTSFAIQVLGDTVSVTTKGFGHRVGMSQYGAQAMAKDGKKYGEILQYYYTGTTLGMISGN